MVTSMARSLGDQNDGPRGKRPARTIEGTATEIVEDSNSASADAEQPPHDDEAAPKAQAQGERAEGEQAEAGAAAPRRGATMPELRGFVTHLTAGLLGGLVGVVALAFFWDRLPATGSEEPAPEIAALEARIGKLEAAPPPATDAEAVTALDQRLETLQGSVTKSSTQLSSLGTRVARLEDSLKTLAKTAREGGSVADAAALAEQVTEAEQRLQVRIDTTLAERDAANKAALETARGEIASLRETVAELVATVPIAGDADVELELDGHDARLAKLETALAEFAVREAASPKSAAAAIAFANLRAAVNAGRAYAPELVAMEAARADQADLMALAANADTGIPTVADLTRTFQAAKEASLAAVSSPADASILESLLSSVRSAVKIRRIDAANTGDDAEAVLARAGTELKQGALAEAVTEIETLSGPPRQAMEQWLGEARARISADETLKAMEIALLKSLAGANGEPD
jgi:hypothetical protein